MKINRINLGKELFNIRNSLDIVNTKLIKHLKTEKTYENGLTNNSKLKIVIKNIHESLLDKNYVLNISIIGEGTYKEIQILEENLNKKFRL